MHLFSQILADYQEFLVVSNHPQTSMSRCESPHGCNANALKPQISSVVDVEEF